jgi:hypothetical protein
LEIAMHVSDILLECSKECARLSRDCRDEKVAVTLFEISARLLSAATHDAELIIEDAHATPQSDPHFGFAGED